MASEMTPNRAAPFADAGEPGAAPAPRTNPPPSAWRANRLWLILSVVAGFATGGPFLLGSFAVRGVVHPVVEYVLLIDGIALLVGIPLWQIIETWRQSRRPLKSQPQSEPSSE